MRDPAFREELLSSDFVFEGRKIPVTPAGVHTTTVYVRDLPVELSDESVKSALSAFGDVYSVRHAYFKDFPELRNGNRLLLMSVSSPIPSSFNVLGFVCRSWYPGQPVKCSICKEPDHLPRACPLSGLCRRCKQPGHVARECGRTGGQPRPASSDPVPVPDPVPVVTVPDPVPDPFSDDPGSEDDEDLSSVSSDQPDLVLPPDVPTPKSPSAKLALVLKKLVRAGRFKYQSNPDPTRVRQYVSALITSFNLVVSPSELDQVVKKACKSNV